MPTGIWVFIESHGGDIATISRELLGKGRVLADACGQPLGALVLGAGVDALAQHVLAFGADTAYVIDAPALAHYTNDGYVGAAAALVREHQPNLLLTGASFQMRDFAASLAAEMEVGLAVDATDVRVEGTTISAVRPSHGGNVVNALVFGDARPAIVAARKASFPEPAEQPGRSGEIVRMAMPAVELRTEVRAVTPKSGAVNLADATMIVSGGRGLGSAENYHRLIPPLAAAFGGAYGASRAIVDAGWVPYEHQVGQTGKTVSPKLYVACGVSGAIQHMAGMRASRTIVAINKDAAAPMMRAATYALVGDVNELLPLLTEEIRRRTNQ